MVVEAVTGAASDCAGRDLPDAWESVRNAFRHAQARQIEAEITYGERLLRVRIRDDGRGTDPELANQGRGGHFGLPGIRERAKQLGGAIESVECARRAAQRSS